MSREYVHGLKDALAVTRDRVACAVALKAAEAAISNLIEAEEKLLAIHAAKQMARPRPLSA